MPKSEEHAEATLTQCELIVGFRTASTLTNPRSKKHDRVHEHPFWQLEILLEGAAAMAAAPEPVVLGAGECLLIPPEVRHSVCREGMGSRDRVNSRHLTDESDHLDSRQFRMNRSIALTSR